MSEEIFEIDAPFAPAGDQPKAIDELYQGILRGDRYQTLLGVTGSGKTFTMAHLVAKIKRPTLIIAPNKTLAAQLYGEFKELFPKSAVEYFVSYYDYYQPEAYIPHTDTYIEKDLSINDEIDRLRHATTSSLLLREDVIVVASVSCIYNLGSPEEYQSQMLVIEAGGQIDLDQLLLRLIEIQYKRNDYEFARGLFRVRGDTVEIFPAFGKEALRIEIFGDEVEKILKINPLTGEIIERPKRVTIYPATHFMTNSKRLKAGLSSIEAELKVRLKELEDGGKLLEAQRLKMRTSFDLEMLREVGYCSGIENYSRHFTGKAIGDPPDTLIHYFPKELLMIIDESHISIPQIRAMYHGDRSRKETLVEHGFRLPSALDNRPLKFDEFEALTDKAVFVSATPGDYEISVSSNVVEQIIRPTGLIDPEVLVRPTSHQIDDLMTEIGKRVDKEERVLVTTLTKKMAEDLTDYLANAGIKVRYLHSDIDTIERIEIITDLRGGKFDVLVGINLLREGLDLPEVSLVAILDADKEGFLRSERSLIQTIGRSARNVGGQVIMYAESVTPSMERAINETNRRRKLQSEYNLKNRIEPQSIRKAVLDILDVAKGHQLSSKAAAKKERKRGEFKLPKDELMRVMMALEEEMRLAAEELRFEDAAAIRDEIASLKEAVKKD
ncbi:MAG: excinuclease ABC subunit UvrB [Actinomycetota bacterium]|nr:excinuclease ABC subunit UvrB [Actinomycetota bacterium]